MYVDDWASSSCREVESIKEAVGSVVTSMQQFSQSQKSKNEVCMYMYVAVHVSCLMITMAQNMELACVCVYCSNMLLLL